MMYLTGNPNACNLHSTLPQHEVHVQETIVCNISGCSFHALGVDTNGDGRICTCEAEAVRSLDVSGNQLISLDLSNNLNLGSLNDYGCELDISEMPGLEEVCVWTMPFPPPGVKVATMGSPNVRFTTECSR